MQESQRKVEYIAQSGKQSNQLYFTQFIFHNTVHMFKIKLKGN